MARFDLPTGYSPLAHFTVYDFLHSSGAPMNGYALRADYMNDLWEVKSMYVEKGFKREDAELYAVPMFRHGTWTDPSTRKEGERA
jgi:hypothetical protein